MGTCTSARGVVEAIGGSMDSANVPQGTVRTRVVVFGFGPMGIEEVQEAGVAGHGCEPGRRASTTGQHIGLVRGHVRSGVSRALQAYAGARLP